MQTILKWSGIGGLGFILIASGCVSLGKYKMLENESAAQQSNLQEADEKIGTLNAQITDLGNRITALEKEKEQLTNSNTSLTEALKTKKGQLSKLVAELTEEKTALEKTVAALEKEKADLKAAQQQKIDSMKRDYDNLVTGLEEEVAAGQVKITQLKGKLTVNVADKIFFDSGKARLNKSGRSVLASIGEVIKSLKGKQVVVEGHTDNTPIGKALKSQFPTNWELSTARATEVVRFLEEKVKIEPHRLVAVGYGESRPVATNETKQGQAQNRRIEIVFQDINWKEVEPMDEKPGEPEGTGGPQKSQEPGESQ